MKNVSVHSGVAGLPQEFSQTLEAAFEKSVRDYHANTLPELDLTKTAVFTSKWSGTEYPFCEVELQTKIADDFSRLSEMGFDTMIVNTGTCYGMLALKTLALLKKEGSSFRLISSKIRGELLEEPNIQTAMMLSCCEHLVYADNAEQYREMILSRVSYVSDETDLVKV